MIDRNALPLIGGPGNRVVEESPATINAQLRALVNGTIPAVMLPLGSTYRPAIPRGMWFMEIGDGPGAGTWIFNPDKLSDEEIADACVEGNHGWLLGHIQTKQELQYLEAVGCTIEIIQAIDDDGTVIQDSAIEQGNFGVKQGQIAILRERHPGATIRVVTEEAMAQQRQEKAVNHG